MPHIHMYIPEDEKVVRKIIGSEAHALDIVWALADLFPKYDTNEIVVIPHLISAEEMALSAHVLPLEFIIDIGTQRRALSDEDAQKIRNGFIERIPELAKINFAVWIREMQSNGFCENKPETEEDISPKCEMCDSIEHMRSKTGKCPGCGRY